MSHNFLNWLKQRGITHESTNAYSPESKGVTERLNETLMDMARTMLLNSSENRRNKMWADAINTANYIRNRIYTKPCRENKTPYETVNGSKPEISHLRVFGSDAFVHTPKQRRNHKFDNRSKKGIFIGYDKVKAYRVYFPKDDKVVISKDVDFKESQSTKTTQPNDKLIEQERFDIDQLNDSAAIIPARIGDTQQLGK